MEEQGGNILTNLSLRSMLSKKNLEKLDFEGQTRELDTRNKRATERESGMIKQEGEKRKGALLGGFCMLSDKKWQRTNTDTWIWIARKPEATKDSINEERQLEGNGNTQVRILSRIRNRVRRNSGTTKIAELPASSTKRKAQERYGVGRRHSRRKADSASRKRW